MEISVEPLSSLDAIMADGHLAVETAVTRGIGRAGRGLQGDLRQQVRAGGLGSRLANAWRLRVYPEGATVSAGAAAMVWTKAPDLIRAFDEGALIRSKLGFWLAIPSDAAPKRGVGGARLTPSNFPEHSYGPLRFVYRRRGPSMLVVDNQRVRGGKAAARRRERGDFRGSTTLSRSVRNIARGHNVISVPMFFLFRQVRLRKRLDVKASAEHWRLQIPGLVDRELGALIRGAAARR